MYPVSFCKQTSTPVSPTTYLAELWVSCSACHILQAIEQRRWHFIAGFVGLQGDEEKRSPPPLFSV